MIKWCVFRKLFSTDWQPFGMASCRRDCDGRIAMEFVHPTQEFTVFRKLLERNAIYRNWPAVGRPVGCDRTAPQTIAWSRPPRPPGTSSGCSAEGARWRCWRSVWHLESEGRTTFELINWLIAIRFEFWAFVGHLLNNTQLALEQSSVCISARVSWECGKIDRSMVLPENFSG